MVIELFHGQGVQEFLKQRQDTKDALNMADILLAEDDESTRRFLAAALLKAGHVVTACADGLEALQTLENPALPFDLLLTDIVMPGLDGLELSSRAMALRPSLKVVFITGFAAMALSESQNHGTPVKVISKPFHLGSLSREIEEILKTAAR
jgi:two-component system cell cycle response regulator CpdR